MYDTENKHWLCKKCNKLILKCIDIDYHNNREHPNFNDKYVESWYINSKKGLSPYD